MFIYILKCTHFVCAEIVMEDPAAGWVVQRRRVDVMPLSLLNHVKHAQWWFVGCQSSPLPLWARLSGKWIKPLICTSLPFHFNLLILACLCAIALSYLLDGKGKNSTPLPFGELSLAAPEHSIFSSSYCMLNLAAHSTWQRLMSRKWNPEIPSSR